MTTTPTDYRVTFDRIGRVHNPPPLTTNATTPEHLADLIGQHALRYLRSSDVDVCISELGDSGRLLVGMFRPAGTFKIEQVDL